MYANSTMHMNAQPHIQLKHPRKSNILGAAVVRHDDSHISVRHTHNHARNIRSACTAVWLQLDYRVSTSYLFPVFVYRTPGWASAPEA